MTQPPGPPIAQPPAGRPVAPPAARPPGPGLPLKKILLIGGPALGGVLLVIILILVFSGGSVGEIHLDAARLPSTTFEVESSPMTKTSIDDSDAREMLMNYRLARMFCPFSSEDKIYISTSLSSLSKMADADTRKKIAAHLQCGEEVRKSFDSDTVTRVRFKEDERSHRLTVIKGELEELPKAVGWTSHSFSGLKGFCLVEKDKECEERSFAALSAEGLSYIGDQRSVTAIAKRVAKPAEELSSSIEALMVAVARNHGLPVRRITNKIDSTRRILMGMCYVAREHGAGGGDFRKYCFPEGHEKALEAIDAKLRAAGMDMQQDLSQADGIRAIMTLVIKDADAAESVEKDLKEFTRDWRSHLENNEGKITKLAMDRAKDSTSSRRKLWQRVAQTYVRAMRKMEVSRDGRSVMLSIEEDFTSAEKKEVKEQLAKDRTERQLAFAGLLAAVMKGDDGEFKSSMAKLAPKSVEDVMDRVKRRVKSYFARDHHDMKTGNIKPKGFPPSSEGWTTDAKECCDGSPWKDLYLSRDSMAADLLQWRFTSKGEGKDATYKVEARLPDGDGTYTVVSVSGRVTDEMEVKSGEVQTQEKQGK